MLSIKRKDVKLPRTPMVYFGPKPPLTELRFNNTHGWKLNFNITICSINPLTLELKWFNYGHNYGTMSCS